MNGRPQKTIHHSVSRLIFGALVLSVFGVGACSDDNADGDQDIIVNTDTGAPDTNPGGDKDAGDADTFDIADIDELPPPDGTSEDAQGPDATDDTSDPDVDPVPACPQTPCQDDLICVDGTCLEDTPANKCAAAEDLGTLSPDGPLTINDTTADASDILNNSCGGGGDEKVYKFTVSEQSRVSFVENWPAQFDASVEFRFDGCEAPGEQLCFDSASSLSANAGATVYVTIEQTVGRGNDFSLELNATPESCTPGEASCSAGVLEVCGAADNTFSYDCADACAPGGDQCQGALCANAIPVSASASFSGDLAAYPSNFNFESNADCTVEGTPVPTPGAEVIFKLESLNADQVVSISAGSSRAMFFMSDCQDVPVCEAVMTGSGSAGDATWTVPAGYVDQDVYLVIDRRNQNAGEFTYAIDISTP